jgi:hypothetical protein
LLIALGAHAIATIIVYLLVLLVLSDARDATSSDERHAH